MPLGGAVGARTPGSTRASRADFPATLQQALSGSSAQPTFLLLTTCGKYQPFWALDSGSRYKTPESDRVTGVVVNGVALTLAASVAAVGSTAGTWYWDQAAGYVYLRLADSSDPNVRTQTVMLELTFRWADRASDLDGYYWEARLAGMPTINLRIEPDFAAKPQTGSGRVTLNNHDNFFNTRKDDRIYHWNWGTTVLWMGAVGLPWNQHKKLATLVNKQLQVDTTFAALDLGEQKSRLVRKFPFETYTLETYPDLRPSDVGRAKQVAYGQVWAASAVCINQSQRLFKIADHAITGFDGFRVQDSTGLDIWVDVDPETSDVSTGQFTLAAVDWEPGQDVSVDFRGLTDDAGDLMDNPADVLRDLLERMGETDFDDVSFTDARDFYTVGYTYRWGDRVSSRRVGLYLDSQTEGLQILNRITKDIRAYLLSNPDGEYRLVPFKMTQAKYLPLLRDFDPLSYKEEQPTGDGRLSTITVKYAVRSLEGWSQSYTYSYDRNQYSRRQPAAVPDAIESVFYDTKDAQELAQWLVNFQDLAPQTYTLNLKWLGWTYAPGDQLRLAHTAEGVDKVLEVLGIQLNGSSRVVSLTLGNLRGFDLCAGFWVGDTETCPDGASLAWDGTQNTFKRQNTGNWHDNNGYANPTPAATDDHRASTWS